MSAAGIHFESIKLALPFGNILRSPAYCSFSPYAKNTRATFATWGEWRYNVPGTASANRRSMPHTHHTPPSHPNLNLSSTIPSSWDGQVDQSVVIGTKPGLKFDIQKLTLKAESRVRLVFQNTDDMLHNLVIVQPNSAVKVGEMAFSWDRTASPDSIYPILIWSCFTPIYWNQI